MSMKPNGLIEVFTDGCASCESTVQYGIELASNGLYDLRVWNTSQSDTSTACRTRMSDCGIREVPAIVVDSVPLACCR